MRGELLPYALCLATLTTLACEPRSFLPGGRLSGELVTEPVSDFSFASSEYGVQVEALSSTFFPSANVRCLVVEGTLYLFTESVFEFGWLRALRRDPRARIRIREELYEVRAVPLTHPADIDPLLPDLLRKYFGMKVSGARYVGSSPRFPGTQVDMNFFRIEPARGG